MGVASAENLYFNRDWVEHSVLRDGTPVELRLITPADRELLREGFRRMSPESRYRRFFAVKNDLTDKELDYLTDIDQINHVAIGAARELADGSREGLGVARFVRLPDADNTAEAAIAVVDDMQGKGLGSLLFQRLMAAATERGIERVRSEVLGSNAPMQEFLRSLEVDSTSHVESGVVTTEFDLPKLLPSHPADEPPRDHAGYQLLRLAANQLVELRRKFPWLRPQPDEAEQEGAP